MEARTCLNSYFKGADFHHMYLNRDQNIGIYIPKSLHRGIPHSGFDGKNLRKVNKKALEWLANQDVVHTMDEENECGNGKKKKISAIVPIDTLVKLEACGFISQTDAVIQGLNLLLDKVQNIDTKQDLKCYAESDLIYKELIDSKNEQIEHLKVELEYMKNELQKANIEKSETRSFFERILDKVN